MPITDDGRLRDDSWNEFLSERTKIVAVAAVSNVLGTINPVAEIVRRSRTVGAVVLVDAAQSARTCRSMCRPGAPILSLSAHTKCLARPASACCGVGELLDSMPPFLGGGSMIRRVRQSGFEPAELPAKFEAGTPPIVSAIGLGAAIDYLQRIGLEAISARAHAHLPGARSAVGH